MAHTSVEKDYRTLVMLKLLLDNNRINEAIELSENFRVQDNNVNNLDIVELDFFISNKFKKEALDSINALQNNIRNKVKV